MIDDDNSHVVSCLKLLLTPCQSEKGHVWWRNKSSVQFCLGFPYTTSHSCPRTLCRNVNSQYVPVGRIF